jgi:hypothetical protein
MKKLIFLICCIIFFAKLYAQNVGIGTPIPQDRLEVSGNIRTNGLRIVSNGSIDLGFGIEGKESNAGRIGYGLFTANSVDIVGGGTSSDTRRIRVWAEGGTSFTGGASFLGNLGLSVSSNTYGKLQVNGRGGTPFSLSIIDSLTNSAGALHFGHVNRPTAGLVLRGTSFGNGSNQNGLQVSSYDGNTIFLYVRGDGNVGIGEGLPAEKLDVSGNITLTGRILNDGIGGNSGDVLTLAAGSGMAWKKPTVTVNDTLSILHFAFTSNDYNASFKHDGNIGYMSFTTGGTGALAHTPLFLPDNAMVTEIKAYLFDNTGSESINLLLQRGQINSLSANTIIAQFSTSAQLAGPQEFTYNTPFTIDNGKYAYYLRLRPLDGTWPGDPSIGIVGVRIAYTYTNQ